MSRASMRDGVESSVVGLSQSRSVAGTGVIGAIRGGVDLAESPPDRGKNAFDERFSRMSLRCPGEALSAPLNLGEGLGADAGGGRGGWLWREGKRLRLRLHGQDSSGQLELSSHCRSSRPEMPAAPATARP